MSDIHHSNANTPALDLSRLPDLNLLRMLAAVLDTASVTRAGERLGLSQPAASRAMAKLRAGLNDPLLVRTRSGYALTPLAHSLRPSLRRALASADEVFAASIFDPLASTRNFKLCATDYGSLTVVVPFARRLAECAPHIGLVISPWTEDTLCSLERGDLDLALHADDALPADFHYREIFRETYVALVRRGHPLNQARGLGARRFFEKLVSHRHVGLRFHDGRSFVTDDVLSRLGAPGGEARLAFPYFNTAPLLVAESDLVMVLPSRVARRYAEPLGLDVIPIPSGRADFGYRIIWHDRVHRDSGAMWLREQLAAAVAQEPTAAAPPRDRHEAADAASSAFATSFVPHHTDDRTPAL